MRDPDDFLVARLRFKHLALIEALGRLHSIRKAARAVHVSEPAVSKALAEVETSFGFALFQRSSAGVTPTERGRSVIEGARLLLNSLRHVRAAAANAEPALPLRLGVNPFVAQSYLPRLAGSLRALAENIRLEVREGAGPHLLQMMRHGEIDAMVIVVSHDDIGRHQGADLVVRALYNETLMVIAPKGHPAARRRTVAWRDVAEEDWILPPPPSTVDISVRNAFLAQGIAPPVPKILSAAPRTNVNLVCAGLGLSVVPSPFAMAARAAGEVDILHLKPDTHLPPVSLVFRKAAAEEPGIQTLLRAVERTTTD